MKSLNEYIKKEVLIENTVLESQVNESLLLIGGILAITGATQLGVPFKAFIDAIIGDEGNGRGSRGNSRGGAGGILSAFTSMWSETKNKTKAISSKLKDMSDDDKKEYKQDTKKYQKLKDEIETIDDKDKKEEKVEELNTLSKKINSVALDQSNADDIENFLCASYSAVFDDKGNVKDDVEKNMSEIIGKEQWEDLKTKSKKYAEENKEEIEAYQQSNVSDDDKKLILNEIKETATLKKHQQQLDKIKKDIEDLKKAPITKKLDQGMKDLGIKSLEKDMDKKEAEIKKQQTVVDNCKKETDKIKYTPISQEMEVDEIGKDGKPTGKKIKQTVTTGPRGGRFYKQHGNKYYITNENDVKLHSLSSYLFKYKKIADVTK